VPQISLNALSGMPAPKTFRIYGTVAHHQVVILVDGDNTHNFIQARLAAFLHLDTSSIATIRVMIGNGSTLDCDTKCSSIPITIQGHPFSVDLYTLPIGGADIVLGVQWLKLLVPVTTDYSSLTMTFNYMGQHISLHADPSLCPSQASAQQLKCLTQTYSISALFQLTHVPDPTHHHSSTTSPSEPHTHPSIDHLLR